jgi:RNA polymerase sigma-70 factor (ECF subfamily)
MKILELPLCFQGISLKTQANSSRMTDLTTDSDLIRQMRNGDKAAFTALYRRHHPAVYRYAVLRCGSVSTAADVVQEVFMGLLSDSLRYDALKGELRYFLFGVARFTAMKLDALNKKHSPFLEMQDGEDEQEDEMAELATDDVSPLEKLLNNRLAEDLRQAIACLPPHYRDVFILFELQELSYLEIAEICQINVGTVRSRLSRARAALVHRLAPQNSQHTLSA